MEQNRNTCQLCEKESGRLINVKNRKNTTRMRVCQECWTTYYEKEVENEKIRPVEKLSIRVDREKAAALSKRKIVNMCWVLFTLLVVEIVGQFLFKFLLNKTEFFSEEAVGTLLSSFYIIGGLLIAVYTAAIVFRGTVYLLCRAAENRKMR